MQQSDMFVILSEFLIKFNRRLIKDLRHGTVFFSIPINQVLVIFIS